jgi:hypothetical protein
MLAGMQGIEIGDAVDAQDHRPAVEHEARLPDLASRLDDPKRGADSRQSPSFVPFDPLHTP